MQKNKHVVEYFTQKKVKLFAMMLGKWNILEELILVLEKPYDTTISLQNQRLTLSDVYSIWSIMSIHLKACAANAAYKTQLAQKLLRALETKKHMIFDNPEMDCCIFLDPRFRHVLTREKQEQAKTYITRLYTQLNSLQDSNKSTNESNGLQLTFDARAELNKLMSAGLGVNATQIGDNQRMSIEDALEMFQPNFILSENSVLDFWETQKNSILYDVANALYSIPPTQVKIEQNFSSVGYVFTDRRYHLSQEMLEAILLIHLNGPLFQMVKKERLDEIRYRTDTN